MNVNTVEACLFQDDCRVDHRFYFFFDLFRCVSTGNFPGSAEHFCRRRCLFSSVAAVAEGYFSENSAAVKMTSVGQVSGAVDKCLRITEGRDSARVKIICFIQSDKRSGINQTETALCSFFIKSNTVVCDLTFIIKIVVHQHRRHDETIFNCRSSNFIRG